MGQTWNFRDGLVVPLLGLVLFVGPAILSYDQSKSSKFNFTHFEALQVIIIIKALSPLSWVGQMNFSMSFKSIRGQILK